MTEFKTCVELMKEDALMTQQKKYIAVAAPLYIEHYDKENLLWGEITKPYKFLGFTVGTYKVAINFIDNILFYLNKNKIYIDEEIAKTINSLHGNPNDRYLFVVNPKSGHTDRIKGKEWISGCMSN